MIYYITRVIAAEIFNTIKDKIAMCTKGKRQNVGLEGDCKPCFDCDLPAVNSVEEIEVENLFAQIDNPGMKNEALENLLKDVDNDMEYTKQRKKDGKY